MSLIFENPLNNGGSNFICSIFHCSSVLLFRKHPCKSAQSASSAFYRFIKTKSPAKAAKTSLPSKGGFRVVHYLKTFKNIRDSHFICSNVLLFICSSVPNLCVNPFHPRSKNKIPRKSRGFFILSITQFPDYRLNP
jgi:hypothetical protein